MTAAPSVGAAPWTPLLARLAAARLGDAGRADPAVREALRVEVRRHLAEVARHAAALGPAAATGDDTAGAALRRLAAAADLLPPLADEVLGAGRTSPARHAGEWAALAGRMRGLLRTPVAAVVCLADLAAEHAGIGDAGRDAVARVRAAARTALELVRDAVQLLELLAGDTPAAAVSPAVRVAVERARSATADAEAAAAGRVLVVDDSRVNRDLLERLLTRMGWAVTQAGSGLQALALARGGGFDLVLLDILMPEVDGFQVLGQLRADHALHELPVVMVSALDEVASVGRCIEMGAADYLTKPIDPVILRARIASVMETRRLRGMVKGEDEGVGWG